MAPSADTTLGVDAALLLGGAATETSEARIVGATGEEIGLTLVEGFAPMLAHTGPRVGFFRPSSSLTPGADYSVSLHEGASVVPFQASAETSRIDAALTLEVGERSVPENRLTSSLCYDGPLLDRPFIKVLTVKASTEPKSQLLLSVVGNDALSGMPVADSAVALPEDPGGAVTVELPLPDGVEECAHIRVFDYAGTLLLEDPRLCVGNDFALSLLQPVQVFEASARSPRKTEEPTRDPSPEPPLGAPSTEPRSSRGCSFGQTPLAPSPWLWVLGGLWLLRAVGSRIEKPSSI